MDNVDKLLLLIALIILFVLAEWFTYRNTLSLREGAKIRRALLRGLVFAERYRTWKQFYRKD